MCTYVLPFVLSRELGQLVDRSTRVVSERTRANLGGRTYAGGARSCMACVYAWVLVIEDVEIGAAT